MAENKVAPFFSGLGVVRDVLFAVGYLNWVSSLRQWSIIM